MGLGREHTPAYIYEYMHRKYTRARTHTPLQLILALLQAQRHLLREVGAASKAAFPNLGKSEFPPTFQRALFPGTQVLQNSRSPELSSASLEALFLSLKQSRVHTIPFQTAPVTCSVCPIPEGWNPGLPGLSPSRETSPPLTPREVKATGRSPTGSQSLGLMAPSEPRHRKEK